MGEPVFQKAFNCMGGAPSGDSGILLFFCIYCDLLLLPGPSFDLLPIFCRCRKVCRTFFLPSFDLLSEFVPRPSFDPLLTYIKYFLILAMQLASHFTSPATRPQARILSGLPGVLNGF